MSAFLSKPAECREGPGCESGSCVMTIAFVAPPQHRNYISRALNGFKSRGPGLVSCATSSLTRQKSSSISGSRSHDVTATFLLPLAYSKVNIQISTIHSWSLISGFLTGRSPNNVTSVTQFT
jgi:hypothetical protein